MTNLKTKATSIITNVFKNRGYYYVRRKDFDVRIVTVSVNGGEQIAVISGFWTTINNIVRFVYYVDSDTLQIAKQNEIDFEDLPDDDDE